MTPKSTIPIAGLTFPRSHTGAASAPADGAGASRASNRKVLPRHARHHNRSLLLRTVYQKGPQSRADLSRATGLAKVTVSTLVSELLEAGYLREVGFRQAKGPGKPAMMIDLAWDSFNIVTLDLSGPRQFKGALMTLDAETLAEGSVPVEGVTGADATSLVLDLAAQLVQAAEKPILGIGVGTPGLVSPEGVVTVAPNLGWTDVDLRALLEDRFDIPTIVHNDANAAALGERLYGGAAENLLLVTIGYGIGSGLILGGQVIHGPRSAVGEIGHVMVGSVADSSGEYSREQVLENWASEPALRQRISDLGADEDTQTDALTEAQQMVLAEAGARLGAALAPVVAALDLDEVVLNGAQDLLAGPLSEETLATIRRRTLPGTMEHLRIRMSEKGPDLVLLGCAAQVLSTFLGVNR